MGKYFWSSCVRFTLANLPPTLVSPNLGRNFRAHSINTYKSGAQKLDISIYLGFLFSEIEAPTPPPNVWPHATLTYQSCHSKKYGLKNHEE